MPEIGHIVVKCKRCGAPRHVPLTAETRPFPGPGTWALRVRRGDEDLGEIHILMRPLPDRHVCGALTEVPRLAVVPSTSTPKEA